ncbi:hypothetical protein EQG49_08460 [Periweissella cryptocerci]|uniref:Surface layer protein A domain-containing protein n=1 Tax=Periweissella cryptocerci TaxID=2506420 RepID=A0A4P6YUR9_9LACO|nr:hypothetical protein [Periweissella cryptocerci]QBO36502.1 hypothetical protein EQG49_08460 [Periweissella cryptocerci]
MKTMKILVGVAAIGMVMASIPVTTVNAASASKYITNAKNNSYVKTVAKAEIGWYNKVNGKKKKLYVPKGTVLKLDGTFKKNGKVSAQFDFDALSYKLGNGKIKTDKNGNSIGDWYSVPLKKSKYKLVKKPTPITALELDLGKYNTYKDIYDSMYVTSDNYLEYYNSKSSKLSQSSKITKVKQSGNKTYLYFKKAPKNLNTKKMKKNQYRLTVKNLKKTTKTKDLDRDDHKTSVGWTKWAKYSVGGKAYFHITKSTAD